jgi:mono/diheme cytochrome c family protein
MHCFAGLLGVAVGQTKKIKEVPVKPSGTTDGAQLYREHCAVCHGVDAERIQAK